VEPTLLLNSSSLSRLLLSTLFLYPITFQNVHSLYDVYAFNATRLLPQHPISRLAESNNTCPLATSLSVTITRKPLSVPCDIVRNVKHGTPADSIDLSNDDAVFRRSSHPPSISGTAPIPNSPYRLHPPPQRFPRCRSWCPRRD